MTIGNSKNLLIVMPAFNESAVIGQTIDDLKLLSLPASWSYQILVVDDGSWDNTSEIAKLRGVKVISHPFNCGVGIALRTGFNWAGQHQYDAVIQVDADGQHPIEEIQNLTSHFDDGAYDIIIGSRFIEGSWNTSQIRRIAMKALAKLVSYGTSSVITDATSGFRLSSRSAIKLFALEYPGEYLGDTVESLVLAHKHGLTIREIPANLRERQGGQASHLSIRSSLHVARVFIMVLLRLSKPDVRK